jgi:hypothetical protein
MLLAPFSQCVAWDAVQCCGRAGHEQQPIVYVTDAKPLVAHTLRRNSAKDEKRFANVSSPTMVR